MTLETPFGNPVSPELFDSFMLDAWDTLGAFENAVAELQSAFGAPTMQRLGMLAHRFKGTAALYGYPQMAALSELAERLMEVQPELGEPEQAGLFAFLERLVVCLRSALERVSARQSEGELGLEFAQIGGTALLGSLLGQNPRAFVRQAVQSRDHLARTQNWGTQVRRFRQDNLDIWAYFAPEVREHLDAMRLVLDESEANEAGLNQLFRSAHTLKGSSYMVGFDVLGDLGHRLEDVMLAVRSGERSFDAPLRRALGEGTELAEHLLQVAEGAAGDPGGELRRVQRQLSALLTGGVEEPDADQPALNDMSDTASDVDVPAPQAAPAAAGRSVRVSTDKLDLLMNLANELVVSRSRITQQSVRLESAGELLMLAQARLSRTARDFEEKYLSTRTLSQAVNRSAPASSAPGDAPSALQSTALQNTLDDLFGDLEFDSYSDLNIVARSVSEMSADLSEVASQLAAQLQALREEDERLGKLTTRLRREVSRARRVPFGQALTRLRRWARTQTTDGNSGFELRLSGETVEVDSHVLEAVVDPLLHLLNNALIHGLEAPEARRAAGKPERGQISVHAAQRGAFLDIEVSDDGAGLDFAAIRRRAAPLLSDPAQPSPDEMNLDGMSEAAVAELIFLPGLSTAASVNTQAGRGVGLDVVASNVRRLGGAVQVRSQVGAGTQFTLSVPLTQQIAEVLLLRVGAQTLGIFTSAVRSLRHVEQSEIETGNSGQTVPYQGQAVPLLRLAELWNQVSAPNVGAPLNVVIVQSGTQLLALAADEFAGLEEVAVQPPGPLLEAVAYLAGSSVASGGQVALLLHPPGLLRLNEQLGQVAHAPPFRRAAPEGKAARVLLVDDSISVRRVVARMLERAGYSVVTAADGYEAIERLRSEARFDAVLTDLEMPRVSGYELLEHLRRHADTADLPSIVMTTRAGDKHQQLAYEVGTNDYFTKPIDEGRLIKRLAELTQRSAAT
ncbi:hybrid sensor histidine kinase/response regulator [Deinococcus sp.]|uniref:hybrid sensor histidine kinase/response regulator n=1 Tax=Deinococcus sp. TaxID=47478 RepID=UPI003B5BCC4B